LVATSPTSDKKVVVSLCVFVRLQQQMLDLMQDNTVVQTRARVGYG
jgi:hypothetical protein